jgi:DNA ligase-1
MVEVSEVVDLISRTSSRTEKMYLLKKNENLPGFKQIMKFIFNPYTHTGISGAKLDKARILAKELLSGTPEEVTYSQVIDYFLNHQTGSDADVFFAAKFLAWICVMPGSTRNTMKLAKAMLTKDLQIGVTATSLNTVYGKDFIPKIGCMLGTPHEDVSNIHWPCIMTEKLDGIRRILIKENGHVRMYSRSGHEDEGLVDIEDEALRLLPNNFVYDGELLADGDYADSIAVRQATNSIANSKGIRHGVTFNVFDMVPVDEYKEGQSTAIAFERKVRLASTFGDDGLAFLTPKDWQERQIAFGLDEPLHFIRPVPILGLAQSFGDVEPVVAKIWARGGEGVMLNTVNGLYEIKRSKELLKVKHTKEFILKCEGFEEGTGRNEERLGALITYYQGNQLGVGSGFTDAQRQEIWDNQDKYRGKMFEIDSFGESINALGQKSLNCPIFKRWVGAEE